MKTDPNLRFHKESCGNCKYFRIHTQESATVSECLLLGRTMGIAGQYESHHLTGWARERVCDFWTRRPNKWYIYTDKNPHWEDQYLTREFLMNRRKVLGL